MTEPAKTGPEKTLTADGINFNLLAFVAVAFAIVGLIGIFATYAAPLSLERAVARETTLDAVLVAAKGANPDAELNTLKPQLDDSVGVLTGTPGGLEQRIAVERVAMRARFTADAAATGLRLRWLIAMMTLMGFVFAIAMMGGSIRRK